MSRNGLPGWMEVMSKSTRILDNGEEETRFVFKVKWWHPGAWGFVARLLWWRVRGRKSE